MKVTHSPSRIDRRRQSALSGILDRYHPRRSRTTGATSILALLASALLLAPAAASAQWELEDSGTKASLRGITNVGGGVAWASGTGGTVLRTEDGGYLWQGCAIPPGAEHLDFRGIQAFDENTAIVMSSGPGDQSRLYKTTDGCRTWKLLFTNPDKDGFFDALYQVTSKQLYVLGDPVGGKFSVFHSQDGGASWSIVDGAGLEAAGGDGAFAASNSSFLGQGRSLYFVTGGKGGAHVYSTGARCDSVKRSVPCPAAWMKSDPLPLAMGNASSGAFSIAGRSEADFGAKAHSVLVAVGGSYNEPDSGPDSATFSVDGGHNWQGTPASPHGYRSSVAYDPTTKTWITVGPNGSDISTDDGRNWRPLGPTPQDQPGSDRDWNALSLPFVVGPHGRVGKLRTNALSQSKPAPARP